MFAFTHLISNQGSKFYFAKISIMSTKPILKYNVNV